MGDIQEELEQILNARYGKDVRQNIHDAIETCYEDGRAGVIDYVARAELEKTATTDQLGRVKVDGETITADADGTIHGAAQVPEGVLVGEGTEITPDRPLLVAHKAAVDSNNNNIAQHFATIENDIGDADEISSIGDGTICGAISAVDTKITSQSTWKNGGIGISGALVSLPTEYNELYITVYKSGRNAYQHIFPKESLGSTRIGHIIGGYYYSSNNYGCVNLSLSKTEVCVATYVDAGVDALSGSTLQVFYR